MTPYRVSRPGLRVRFAPPLGPFPQEATVLGLGEYRHLRKTTSAAYGVGRDAVSEALPGSCPVSPFFASTAESGVLPGEERAHPARSVGGFWWSWD